jgi:hypothetical protein
MSSKDEKEQYLKLTMAVYRVTGLLEEGDYLKQEIRRTANKILADLIWSNPHPRVKEICDGIRMIDVLFGQAEKKGTIDPRNFSVLRREYKKIDEDYRSKVQLADQSDSFQFETILASVPAGEAIQNGGGRKEKLLNIIKNQKKIQVGELMPNFPNISRRTILRDLDELHREGFIVRTGEGRGANYAVKL